MADQLLNRADHALYAAKRRVQPSAFGLTLRPG
jgi:predicted signal transduction protein with EAL and GGDEF domain